ncbi:MAG: DUF3667 domain-containing protein [Gammaproteobacteria bacterium]|nr:DUF3667 domain-containing protein [Gammaproteobacteria bacterium]
MTEEKDNPESEEQFQPDGAETPLDALEKKLADEDEQFSADEIDEKLEQAESSGIDYQLAQATQSTGLEHLSVNDLTLVEQAEEQPDEQAAHECLNCVAPLKGPYCHNCGQPDRHFIRFFPKVLWDMVNEAFDFDSKVFRTILPLLFSPARLTMEYIAGRRARYVNPLRLYIITSVLFFITVNILEESINIITVDNEHSGIHITDDSEDMPGTGVEKATSSENDPANKEDEQLDIILDNGEEWHPETNPITFADTFSEETTKEINQFLWPMAKKLENAINDDPSVLIDEFLNTIPQMMFILLPLFALLLKLTYIYKKHYYMEHLILALHSHSFIFLTLMIIMLLNIVSDNIEPDSWLMSSITISKVVLYIWIPINLYLSQKRLYAQGYFLTTIKYIFVASLYWMLLGVTAMLAFAVGLYSL